MVFKAIFNRIKNVIHDEYAQTSLERQIDIFVSEAEGFLVSYIPKIIQNRPSQHESIVKSVTLSVRAGLEKNAHTEHVDPTFYSLSIAKDSILRDYIRDQIANNFPFYNQTYYNEAITKLNDSMEQTLILSVSDPAPIHRLVLK